MGHDYTLADQQYDDRETLDEMALAAYYRCRDGAMTHGEAMQVARDDMAIRSRVAARAARRAA